MVNDGGGGVILEKRDIRVLYDGFEQRDGRSRGCGRSPSSLSGSPCPIIIFQVALKFSNHQGSKEIGIRIDPPDLLWFVSRPGGWTHSDVHGA